MGFVVRVIARVVRMSITGRCGSVFMAVPMPIITFPILSVM